jgi:hypothetical protein
MTIHRTSTARLQPRAKRSFEEGTIKEAKAREWLIFISSHLEMSGQWVGVCG